MRCAAVGSPWRLAGGLYNWEGREEQPGSCTAVVSEHACTCVVPAMPRCSLCRSPAAQQARHGNSVTALPAWHAHMQASMVPTGNALHAVVPAVPALGAQAHCCGVQIQVVVHHQNTLSWDLDAWRRQGQKRNEPRRGASMGKVAGPTGGSLALVVAGCSGNCPPGRSGPACPPPRPTRS